MDGNKQIYDNFLKQAHYVDMRAMQLADDMLEVLNRSLEDISAKLAKLEVKYLDADDYNRLSIAKKQQLLQEQAQSIRDIVATTYSSNINTLVNNAMLDGMTYAQAQTAAILSPLVHIDLANKAVTLPQVISYQNSMLIDGATIKEWLSRMEATSAQRITQAARQALVQGMSVSQTASLMRSQGVEGSRPQISALSRTALMSGSNYAREQSLEEFAKDLDYKWKYCGVLDNRTCLICGKDDGRIFDKDEPRPQVPRHINCMCVYIPIFFDDIAYTRPSVKWDSRQVNHRDGSTSTKFSIAKDPKTEQAKVELTQENYSQWLKRQLQEDPSFVRSILGKTRYELFASGKLTLNGMVSDGRIKNLSEL